MKRIFVKTLVFAAVITAAIMALAGAAPHHQAHKNAPITPPKCVSCGMTLSDHWTKDTPVAMQLSKTGPLWFCCSSCKMPSNVLFKAPKCAACGMTFSTHWTKATPVAVQLTKDGPLLFCCHCKMPKKVLYTAPKCPSCGMTLSTHYTKETPVAIELKKNGPILYCCASCKMPKSVLVKKGK